MSQTTAKQNGEAETKEYRVSDYQTGRMIADAARMADMDEDTVEIVGCRLDDDGLFLTFAGEAEE